MENGKAAVDEASEAASSMRDDAARAVHEVAGRVQAAGGQAADYVRHQYDDMSGRARDTYTRARDAVNSCEETTSGYVRQSPLTAILVALGLGVLIGLIWHRRD